MKSVARVSIVWLVCLLVAASLVGLAGPARAVPAPPTGPTCGLTQTTYTYTAWWGWGYDYMFSWGDATVPVWSSSNIATHLWTGRGIYPVKVQTRTSIGVESGWSSALMVSIGNVLVAPTAPATLTATSGVGQIVLAWSLPSDNNGPYVATYSIYKLGPPPWPIPTPVYDTVPAPTRTFTDVHVVNGVTYRYWVTASNCVGMGPASPTVSQIPGIPGAPTLTSAVPGVAQVTLQWTAPTYTGSAAITNYRIYRGTMPGSEVEIAVIGNVLTYTNTGLANGQQYCYKISAQNAAGVGPQSNELCTTTPAVPGAPTGLTAVAGNGQVTLTWVAPVSNGGSAITNYRIYRGTAPGAETFLVEIGNVLTYVNTGLANGQQYCFQVSAKNAVGEGPKSNELCVTTPNVPGAPTGLAGTEGNAQVVLTWVAPTSTGGSPITNYRIYRGTSSAGEVFLIEIGNVLTYTNSGLTNGQTYCYQVSAKNAVGEGPKSAEVCKVPKTIPGAPTGLSAAAGNAQITLTWIAPSSNGGSAVTNYKIYRGTSAGGEVLLVTVGNVLTYTNTGLTNGVRYYYQVSAVNAVGEGPKSSEASATPGAPATPPSAPQNLQATGGNAQVILSWTAPSSTGGSPVTNYLIYRGTTSGGEAFLIEVGNVLTYTDTGLTNGVQYYYQVSAKNAVGEGAKSIGASATPRTIPTEPLNPRATAGNTQVVLDWAAPASDGGAAIANYRIYRGTTSGAEVFLIEVGNVFTYTDTGLTNGQAYFYQVSAKNAAGEGPKSDEASAIPVDVPGAPTGLTVTGGNAQATLTWVAPSSVGGAPITNYRIYRGTAAGSEAYLIEVGNVLTHTDTGLTNGVTYFYQVSAKNAAGEGLRSAEASALPRTTPSAPLNVIAAASNAQVTVTWTAPSSDGGSSITNYRVYRGTSSGTETFLAEIGNALTYTDTGLTNGVTYYYEVSAKNAAGEGPKSIEASATPRPPMTAPLAPGALQASAGNAQVTLTWTAPASDGGSAILNYKVYRSTTSGSLSLLATVGNILTFTDTGLTNGVTYYYQVSAANSVGEGPRTAEVTGKPVAPADTTKPSVVITSPAHLATLNAKIVTVTGTATDDVAVAKVELSTDGTTWVTVTGMTAWTGSLSLVEGTNTIYARATDTSGNTNTATIQVTYEVPPPLEPGGWLGWFVPVLVVVIAVIVGAAVILLRRRRKPAPQSVPPAPP